MNEFGAGIEIFTPRARSLKAQKATFPDLFFPSCFVTIKSSVMGVSMLIIKLNKNILPKKALSFHMPFLGSC